MSLFGRLPAVFFALLRISLLHGQEARPGRVEVAVGDGCGVALKSDGSVWTWGANGFAQPGKDANNPWSPARVPGLSGIRHVAAGVDFILALAADGAISTWGSAAPTAIHGLPRIVSIAAGGHHALALDSSGSVWNWGEGSGPIPQRVPDLAQVIAIAAGDRHNIALDASGHVWVWGEHGISDIDGGSSTQPRPVPGLSDMTAVAGGEQVTLGLRKDGTVWSIGSHDGSSPSMPAPNKPTRIAGLSGVKAVAARQQNAVALKADGTVWTWGDNRHSQLGNSAIHADSSSQAVRAGTLAGIVAIAAGGDHLAAVSARGVVWTWGRNEAGSLGVDPKDLDETDVPIQAGQPVPRDPPDCNFAPGEGAQSEILGCSAANQKVIRFCGDRDPESETWKNVNYRFGPADGLPDLMFPAHPESAPPSLFYAEEEQNGNNSYQVVRFSTGPYTYRVHWGWETAYFGDGTIAPRPAGVGWVDVEDAKGEKLSHIACNVYVDRDLSKSLPRDPKRPAGR